MADVAYAREANPWWAILLWGVLMILLGIFVFVWPASTTVTVIWFIGIYWLITGVASLIGAFTHPEHRVWTILTGLLSIVVGGWITAMPFMDSRLQVAGTTLAVLGATVIVWAIASLVIGGIELVAAFRGAGWGMGIWGAISIVVGLILLFNILTAAVILPFVYGIFAIAGGIAAIVWSFRVRSMEKRISSMPTGGGAVAA